MAADFRPGTPLSKNAAKPIADLWSGAFLELSADFRRCARGSGGALGIDGRCNLGRQLDRQPRATFGRCPSTPSDVRSAGRSRTPPIFGFQPAIPEPENLDLGGHHAVDEGERSSGDRKLPHHFPCVAGMASIGMGRTRAARGQCRERPALASARRSARR